MEIDAVNSVPIVGQPVAYGIGVLVLFGFGLSRFVGRYPLTMVHEGGHMLASVASMRRIHSFTLADDTSGLTVSDGRKWAFSTLVFFFAGYAVPSLLGLLGATLIASGATWSVLILTLILSLLAVVPARNALAFTVPALVAGGVVWTLLDGTPTVQAAVAVGIVWYLLVGGAVRNVSILTTTGDAADLQKATVVVPAVVWKLAWNVISLFSLAKGAMLLLSPA